MTCYRVPTTIKVWESKPISCNYICFDAALLVILPSLSRTYNPTRWLHFLLHRFTLQLDFTGTT